jgi:hypothetical protein
MGWRPMSNTNGRKFLSGRDEIIAYCNLSKQTFYKFLDMGLPVRVFGNRLYAHKDNIDEYFKRWTRSREKNVPLDVE